MSMGGTRGIVVLGSRLLAAKGHGPGFTAELDRFPDDDVTIIVLSNSYGTASQHPITDALAADCFRTTTSTKYTSARAVRRSRETLLASYAGQYQYGPDYFDPNAGNSL